MATEVLMPKMGLTMTEGTIEEWKFKEGDTVKKGDILFSVATDKLTNDVECDTDGVLLKILLPEGETGACKSVIAYIGEAGEAVPGAAPAAAAPAAAPAAPAAAPAPAAAAVTAAGEVVAAPMPGNILKVNVSQGQAVKAGDVLVVLEAMKMENEIMAPRDGSVAQVVVSKGAVVDTGAALVVLA